MAEAKAIEAARPAAEEEELLKIILEEIHRAAEEEAQRILREAEEEAQRIIEEAKQKAKELREEKIQRMLHERRAAVEREIAPKRLEIKRRYIREKYQLLFNVFDQVTSQAEEKLKKSDDYNKFLEAALIRALKEIKSSDVVVHPAPREKGKVSAALKEALKKLGKRKVKAKIGDTIKSSGGVFVESTDGREYFNATLEAKKIEIRQRVLPEIATKMLKGF